MKQSGEQVTEGGVERITKQNFADQEGAQGAG